MKKQSGTGEVEKLACSAKSEHACNMIRNGIAALRNHEGRQAVLNILRQELQDLEAERCESLNLLPNEARPGRVTGGRGYTLFTIDGGRND